MAKTGLKKWFGEKWVDLSRPIYKNGKLVGFEPCGRKKATEQSSTKDYPKCRPLKAAMAMSAAERKRAVKRKRKAEADAPFKLGRSRAPVMVRTNPGWGSRIAPRFDAGDLLDMGEPTYEYFDANEIPEHDEDMLYRGRNVTWVGSPGVMMRIDADMVLPIRENLFYPDQIATLFDYIQQHPDPILRAPLARVHFVDEWNVEETQELEEQGYLHEEFMTRPWEEEDIGRPYAVLVDGNHRSFASILAGEPYIWVYVQPNHRKDVEEFLN